MKVVADTIEVLCSPRATPLSDAVAVGALAMLVETCRATADPTTSAARGRGQFAVAMALPQLAAVGVGLVAALRHQLGGGLGVPTAWRRRSCCPTCCAGTPTRATPGPGGGRPRSATRRGLVERSSS